MGERARKIHSESKSLAWGKKSERGRRIGAEWVKFQLNMVLELPGASFDSSWSNLCAALSAPRVSVSLCVCVG